MFHIVLKTYFRGSKFCILIKIPIVQLHTCPLKNLFSRNKTIDHCRHYVRPSFCEKEIVR